MQRKGATYYGIAMAVGRIAESIVKDQQAVLPVSVVLVSVVVRFSQKYWRGSTAWTGCA